MGFLLPAAAGQPAADGLSPGIGLYYVDSSDGLPQNSVRDMVVDENNFVWVGTERGLARYDGHRFIDFSEKDERIPVDVLLSMYRDGQDRIWLNWYKNDPQVLIPATNELIDILPANGVALDLNQRLWSVFEDSRNRAWFAGTNHLYWMEPDGQYRFVDLPEMRTNFPGGVNDTFYVGVLGGLAAIDVTGDHPNVTVLPWPVTTVSSRREGSEATLGIQAWQEHAIICTARGIYRVKGVPDQLPTPVGPPQDSVFAECRVLGDTLLVNIWQMEKFVFELTSFDLRTLAPVGNPAGLPGDGRLADVFTDSGGNHWVVIGDALYVKRTGATEFAHVELRTGIFGFHASMSETHGGEVWVRTDGAGIAVFAPHRTKFTTVVPPRPGGRPGPAQARRITVDAQGDAWLGLEEWGIGRWDRGKGKWRHYLADEKRNVREVHRLDDDSLWAADLISQQLLRFDRQADSWREVMKLSAVNFKLGSHGPDSLLVTSGPNLWRFRTGTRTADRLNEEDIESAVRAMATDSAANVWLGMHGPGLVRVAPDGKTRHWNTSNSELSSDQIFALHFDRDGMLWIGTWHGGLLRFDTEKERWKHYDTAHGLPDDTVFGILEDDHANLWLSTYKGLVRFKPCDGQDCSPRVHTFNHHDGLQGDEFDAEAFYRSETGELFFGGENGLNVFHPEAITLNENAPTLAISSATLNGQPLPGSVSAYRPGDRVYLNGDFGELRIELSALDYNAPQKNLYEYRVSGSDWINLREPALVLRGLPEGEQVLEFRASNNDGVWSKNTARLEVHVSPPLYRHPAVLVSTAALLVFIPLIYYQRRQARLLAARKLLRRRVAERTRDLELASSARERFFANVSHEIAAPLHMILMMLEQHRSAGEFRDDRLYLSATGYAAQLLAYLRHLVDGARSLEVDNRLYRVNARAMIDALVDVNRPVADGLQIELARGEMPDKPVKVYRHSPSSIFSNLLCNALTYTPEGGTIRIAGSTLNGKYRFTVENSIHPEYSVDLESAMNRGQRGPFDATAFGGHGLGLSIVAETAHSLDGEVYRHRSEQNTIVFEVELPLADNSLPPLPDITGLTLTREQQIALDSIEPSSTATGPRSKAVRGLRVLIVEDDDRVTALMTSALEGEYDVITAANCTDGIAMARSQLPDVILCDLFLPDRPGFELLKTVRDNRMTMDALFLMITASVSETDRETGIRLGVDQFIHKPVSAGAILGTIRNHLSLGEQRHKARKADELRNRARQDNYHPAGRNFSEAIAEALEELYTDPSTSIEDLQTRLAMSYPALIRKCRERLGKTPKRLLVEKRVEKAKELLEHSAFKIGLIAEMVGFTSHAQFATTFRKETGLSPAQYRRGAR